MKYLFHDLNLWMENNFAEEDQKVPLKKTKSIIAKADHSGGISGDEEKSPEASKMSKKQSPSFDENVTDYWK